MNKIIVLPGTADAIFFINEVDYIRKNFDEIVVISYNGNNEAFCDLAKDKGFKYYVIKPNIFKAIININFYKWLFDVNTIEEIKKVFLSKKVFFKLLYIFHYGLFYVEAKKYIDREITKNSDVKIYLYSFWLTRGAYTIANYNINRRYNIKKILSRAHGYDLYEERNSTNFLPFRYFIDRNLDELHFISNHGINYFSNRFQESSLSSKKFISRLGTFNFNLIQKKINKKNKICIASCSSIIPIKRLDLIIDFLANTNVPFEWIHIGMGSKVGEIRSYATERLKGKTFHFLGQIVNTEILNIYEKYDVDFLINMSDSEGIPMSIMEAMSMGIPVIARNVGGISEIVNNSTGYLIESIDNLDYVYKQINTIMNQRLNELDKYIFKSSESLNNWKQKFEAKNNYDIFFNRIINND